MSLGFDSPEIADFAIYDTRNGVTVLDRLMSLIDRHNPTNYKYAFFPEARNSIWLSGVSEPIQIDRTIEDLKPPESLVIVGNKKAYDANLACFQPVLAGHSTQPSDIILTEINTSTLFNFQEAVFHLVNKVRIHFGLLSYRQLESLAQSLVGSIKVLQGEISYNDTLYQFPLTSVCNEEYLVQDGTDFSNNTDKQNPSSGLIGPQSLSDLGTEDDGTIDLPF